jgi:hypothetical protein
MTGLEVSLKMTDETPLLSPEAVRDEAREILLAIDASRGHPAAFEDNWRKLWQLLREAKAAYLPGLDDGPWYLTGPAHREVALGLPTSLTAGSFHVPIWPPEEARSGADLPRLLNWAGVPAPHG